MKGKRGKPSSKGRSRLWLRFALIAFAVVVIAFFALLQSVRMGVFGALPSEEELRCIRHEQATLVLADDGSLIGKLFAQDRTNVAYDDLPQHLIDALVSTEDARFFSHAGVDGRSYLRVFFRTLLGRDRSGGGGSTISQQVVKNLYGRTRHGLLTVPVNKMKEALVAQRLERVLPKNDVLVLYFNSVPFGENTYGIEAAAQRFFDKPTKRLDVLESAVLVGMLKANTSYNPRLYPERSKGRRDQVLELMHGRGHLSRARTDSLRAEPLTLRYTGGDALDLHGYFNQQVAAQARTILKEIERSTGVRHDLEKDGLRIITTLDARLQRMAADAAHAQLAAMQPKLDRELRASKARGAWEKRFRGRRSAAWKANASSRFELYEHSGRRVDTLSYRDSLWHYHRLLNASFLAIEPTTGAVRAWVGGNDHRYLPYDLVQARRSVASTIKPIVYAAALERGMEPCDYLDNTKRTYGEYDDWEPDNFGKDTTEGEVAMWHALARSMNRPTVDLYFRVGADKLRRTMQRLGLPADDADKPAVALGASSISLLELLTAYAAFANGGSRIRPQLIQRITDANGKVIYKAPRQAREAVLSNSTAAGITTMLQRAVNEGTGAALRGRYALKGPYAGKTGTSQDYTDAWFVAYTSGLVVGSWVGAFDPSIRFTSANGTGGQLALPVVGQVLRGIEANAAMRKRYVTDFGWMDGPVDMDCPPTRTEGAVARFMERLFHPSTPDTLEEKGPSFFERLFKKKE
ncbi:MAG: transglycosylase domain-containing protein [Flavobacteriales bacterium]|nr:transglycosylase domain-containing protein [Flavobacteriales bacterium]